jgi:hypothetical protein
MLVIIIIIIIILLIILIQKKDTFENKYIDINNIKRITKEVSINRPVESPNLSKVKVFVIDELNKLGLDVVEQKFTRFIKGKDYKFSNIIAKNKLVNDNYIILGAHIDGPQIDLMESANDAATCIALIIEIVRNLLNNNPNYPIMIVFFDGEEAINGDWGDDNTLSGSNYFVEKFNKNIKLLMIFDLIGADIEKNKIYHFINNGSNKNLMKQLADINKNYSKQIFVDPDIQTSNIGVINDYTPFNKKYNNLVGLNIIPATFPDNHHNVNDNYNNVNWEYIDIFSNVVYEFLNNKS